MKYFVTARLSENMSETPEGFLVCPAVSIGRTGELEYGPGESPIEPGSDGIARVTRDAAEIFHPKTIASFEGKPLTIGHPEDFVNPQNWRQLSVGTIQNVRRGEGSEGCDLLADIIVTDAHAIALVKSGLREVSCGYEAEWTQTGVGIGKQTQIVGNHLALVEQGRAGSQYKINDHKGVNKMKLTEAKESIKKLFGKAQDDAMKVIDEASGEKKKDDKASDEGAPPWADAMCKQMDALAQKVDGIKGGKDEEKPDDKEKSKDEEPDDKEKSKDADPMAKVMDALDALSKRMDAYEAAKAGDEEEESEDEEGAQDDDFEESTMAGDMVGDEKARIEILAPGLKAEGKDAKRRALKVAYKATDHKMLIDGLNGGKAIDFDKAPKEKINYLFTAASEAVKISRTNDFSKWKQISDSAAKGDARDGSTKVPTVEELNERAAKYHEKQGV